MGEGWGIFRKDSFRGSMVRTPSAGVPAGATGGREEGYRSSTPSGPHGGAGPAFRAEFRWIVIDSL
jgi:hypothetical protein